MSSGMPRYPSWLSAGRSDTNLDSKKAPASGYPGGKEDATEAYILVRRGTPTGGYPDEGNKSYMNEGELV